MVVTNASLESLASVGVAQHSSDSGTSSAMDELSNIAPGMEFMDNMYIMQIQQLFSNKIHAKRVYKIVDNGSSRSLRTVKVHSPETVIYTDVVYVYEQIQKMLE
jgi:hypothetical protein